MKYAKIYKLNANYVIKNFKDASKFNMNKTVQKNISNVKFFIRKLLEKILNVIIINKTLFTFNNCKIKQNN